MAKIQEQAYSRPPLERMMRLHGMLQNRKYPNCPTMARELEISVRTLKRDVAFMKCRLNLPIEYDSQKYGYYYSKPVTHFPSVSTTESELFALMVAHKAIAQYNGTSLQKPLETAFRKLTSQLGHSTQYVLGGLDQVLSFRPFGPGDTDLDTFQKLTSALEAKFVVTFDYKNLGAKTFQRRRVHPYHLACIENQWYLFAHDVDRKAMRTFVLTRLKKFEITHEKFTRSKDFNADEYLKGSFQVYKGDDDYEVVIDFDDWATVLIKERKWHPSQNLTELPDGSSRLRLRLNNLEEVESWVSNYGHHATVMRPVELRERLKRTAELLMARYGDPVPNAAAPEEELKPLGRQLKSLRQDLG